MGQTGRLEIEVKADVALTLKDGNSLKAEFFARKQSLLFRLSSDYMRPTHIMLYLKQFIVNVNHVLKILLQNI